MGLRIWKESDDEVVAEEAAAKLDRAAAVRRSTIRREPSVRPGRDILPPQSISVFLRNRHQNMLRTRDRLRQEERETDSQIAQLQSELERLQRNRRRNRPRIHDDVEAPRAGRGLIDSSASSQDSPAEDENAVSNTQRGTENNEIASLPPAPRESSLRFELHSSSLSRSSSPWRYQVLSRTSMPSPPRSSNSELRDRSIPDGPIPGESWSNSNPSMPALTEGFAPAQRASRRDVQHHSDETGNDFQGLETPPPESWEGSYAPLQRVGHLSPRPAPRVDGLGDRRRSLSPYSDPNEEDTWMSNLLTTMDTSRSNSANSLASSASDSLGRSNNSSQTTSTSFGEIGSLDDTCELDLPEGITEDDVREIRERHSHSHSHQPLVNRRTYNRLWSIREHMDRVGSPELDIYNLIRHRLIRQQPIPQDWWVAIGLPSDYGNLQ